MIDVSDLGMVYRPRKRRPWSGRGPSIEALRGLTFQIPTGKVFGLLGLNGAGKTTTLKILSTLLLPTSGRASIGKFDVVRDAGRIRRMVNMVSGGERMLYWRLTGLENLLYFAALYGLPGSVAKRRATQLVKLVGLDDAADRRVEEYSKGMKQRLQMARGLINEPSYLFLDEPTLGLDAPIARELRALVREELVLELGMTVIFTSHDLHEAEELCDEVFVIHQGEAVVSGSPTQLLQRLAPLVTCQIVVDRMSATSHSQVSQLNEAHNVNPSIRQTRRGIELSCQLPREHIVGLLNGLSQGGSRLIDISIQEPSLEDALVPLFQAQAGNVD